MNIPLAVVFPTIRDYTKPVGIFLFMEVFMSNKIERHQVRTAILVDGGFYRKRAKSLWGSKSPVLRAKELHAYCYKHLRDNYENRYLYRIFYYDCPPINKNVFNPLTRRPENLGLTEEYSWMNSFLEELKKHRKFALRMGKINEHQIYYSLKGESTKRILRGDLLPENVVQSDLELNIEQKGVDMRIGVDISSLAFKKQVNQIILIAGDSDFVPAAKQARREGIDFILDPMHSTIRPDLFEHIDGIRTPSMPEVTK